MYETRNSKLALRPYSSRSLVTHLILVESVTRILPAAFVLLLPQAFASAALSVKERARSGGGGQAFWEEPEIVEIF